MVGWAVIAAIVVLCLAVYWISRAAQPDVSYEAAQRVAEHVQSQVRAAVLYNAGMQTTLDAKGNQSWTQTITVKGATTRAAITTTANGPVMLIDVTVNTRTFRTFVSLVSNAVPSGSVLHG